MRAVDRNVRTPNNSRFTPAQRRLAGLVCALRRAQDSWNNPPAALVAELAESVASATWGPFGSFFVTVSRPHWAGVDHTYKTLWGNRRPILTARIWADRTHSALEALTPAEGEQRFQEARSRRREAAAKAAEGAARARRIIGRATPAQRAFMHAQAWGCPGSFHPLIVKHGAQPINGWEFDGSFLTRDGERIPAHAALRGCTNDAEVARVVRDLELREERAEREAARARAAGVARIGRAVAEAAWAAVCLAREEAAVAAVQGMRRIHA